MSLRHYKSLVDGKELINAAINSREQPFNPVINFINNSIDREIDMFYKSEYY
jgi:hypothetical protein